MARKPSPQTLRVLEALADDPGAWRHGYELGAEVGLMAGSLYPILMRLHDRGLLDAEWEDEAPTGRPRRHHYRLTAAGAAYLAATSAVDVAGGSARAGARAGAPAGSRGAAPRGAW